MAVIRPLRVYRAQGVSSVNFTPPAGRGAIIKNIKVGTSTYGIATTKSGKFSVLPIYVAPDVLNHLAYTGKNYGTKTILERIKEDLGLNAEIPIANGDTFYLSLPGTASEIEIIYEEVDATDIKPELPNTKMSKEQIQLLYGTNATDITTTSTIRLTKSITPGEFTSFPFETEACPFDILEVHAVLVTDVQTNTFSASTNHYAETTGVSIWHNRERLFAETDLPTFICKGEGADAGSTNTSYCKGMNDLQWNIRDPEVKIFKFAEPIRVSRNEEFFIEVNVRSDTEGNIPAETIKACVIGKAIRA